jgi:hypothetical protein
VSRGAPNRFGARPRPSEACASFEEIKAGGLVLPLAAFGGAAREVAIALGLVQADRIGYPEYGPSYHETYAALNELSRRHPDNAGPIWETLAATSV